ncbi:RNA polymerase sigma factor [Dietzia kunjamensis]|uniref:RNA polymerase sigma factor n=1 Tax=Dietzia kunjamensis TaxID=322509 RepID=UPI0039BD5F77
MTAPDLRTLTPQVIGILIRRGADFATAEDAVQEALKEALRVWPDDPPRDPHAWLTAVAWRRFLDIVRSEGARRRREQRAAEEQGPGSSLSLSSSLLVPPDPGDRTTAPGPATAPTDDTLWLYFLCAHPSLPMPSAIALTLRAVGGLTTRQIARAFLVPEATMAQRISRAKRTLAGERLDRPGDVATVLRVLYLVFNEGYTGEVDLAAEALRLTRQLSAAIDHPEVRGLLALMLLHHARRAARFRSGGAGRDAGAGEDADDGDDDELIPLAEQDRTRWDARAIAEGVAILQAALARDQLGEYQAQAAIAALHADAARTAETDWVQIVEWYDELLALRDNPVARLGRAVAVGHAVGPHAGLAALVDLPESLPRRTAAQAYLHELAGDTGGAAGLYGRAATEATSVAERRYLARKAAELRRAES